MWVTFSYDIRGIIGFIHEHFQQIYKSSSQNMEHYDESALCAVALKEL